MLHFAYELYLPCLSAVIHSSYCLSFFPFCLFPFTFLPEYIVLGVSSRPKCKANVTTANSRYLPVKYQNPKMPNEISACWIWSSGVWADILYLEQVRALWTYIYALWRKKKKDIKNLKCLWGLRLKICCELGILNMSHSFLTRTHFSHRRLPQWTASLAAKLAVSREARNQLVNKWKGSFRCALPCQFCKSVLISLPATNTRK